jgi:hypothetical protein
MPNSDESTLYLHILIHLDDVDRKKWHSTMASPAGGRVPLQPMTAADAHIASYAAIFSEAIS